MSQENFVQKLKALKFLKIESIQVVSIKYVSSKLNF